MNGLRCGNWALYTLEGMYSRPKSTKLRITNGLLHEGSVLPIPHLGVTRHKTMKFLLRWKSSGRIFDRSEVYVKEELVEGFVGPTRDFVVASG